MKDIIWVSKNLFECGEKCVLHLFCSNKEYLDIKTKTLGECLSNGGPGYYKFKEEEPVKIPTEYINPQTKYEWVKERHASLFKIAVEVDGDLHKELLEHAEWLIDNKPTNFQPCTHKNTKVGDEVIYENKSELKRHIDFIHNDGKRCVVTYLDEPNRQPSTRLALYQIDLNNTEE